VVTVTDTVLPSRDTYISKTLLNKNFGSSDTLRTGGPNRNRALLAFDSAAIAQAVGTGQLDSAWLELTIVLTDGLGASGRTFDLHRLLSTWTELGATWNCPVDANTANDSPDCTGSSWDMTNGNAYASSYTRPGHGGGPADRGAPAQRDERCSQLLKWDGELRLDLPENQRVAERRDRHLLAEQSRHRSALGAERHEKPCPGAGARQHPSVGLQ
jgi:hypothetical protein